MENGVGQGELGMCCDSCVRVCRAARREGVLKLQHVFRMGTAKAIDTLGVVTDDHHVVMVAAEDLTISD